MKLQSTTNNFCLPVACHWFLTLLICISGHIAFSQEGLLVTFQLDVKNIKKVPPVGVRGNTWPLSWDKTLPLEDKDGDGVFDAAIRFANSKIGDVVEYKFVYGNNPIVWELEGSNRILILNDSTIHLGLLTWNIARPISPENLPKLSPEMLLQDFSIAKQSLRALHPGLYRYRTPAQIDSLFNQYEAKMGEALSYREVYLLYSELLANIQCGHTYANFFNQSGFIQEIVFNQADKLPFLCRIVDRKMIVTQNLSGIESLDGMPEIAAINGIPVQEIINSLKALVKADGANDAKRVADLNLFGIGPYESFDVYFPLLFPPVNGQYMLEIMPAGGQGRQEVPVRPITRNERTLRMQKSASASVQPDYKLWELTFWEDGTAYLRLSTFDAFILDFEWKDFLDNAFAEIKKRKSQNLVLDIRWNEGGQDEILLYLGRMLAKAPISPTPRKDYVAYERVPDDLRPYLFTWMEDVYDFKGKIEKKDDNGLFLLKKGRDFNIKPASNAFKGNIYLLVNAANSSATFYFAEISKETGMARILGETTGGSQQGLNGGVMFFVRLPNSKIEFDIPIIGSYSLERPAGGISPDIYVQETVETIRSGQDPALEAVRRLLKQ